MNFFITKFTSIMKRFRMIDVLFVILSLFLVIGIYFLFKRDVSYITIRVKVTDENILYASNAPPNYYALRFIVGDKEIDELGQTLSEIVGVESYRLSPETMVTYLDIKLRAIYNPRTQHYGIRGKTIVFGESITFYFSNVKVTATVMDFPGFSGYKNMKTGTTIVKAQLRYDNRQFSDVYGVPEFLAYALKVGDTVRDSKQNVLAKILEVQVTPAKRTVVNSVGNAYQIEDPDLKDVYYTVELTTKTDNNQIYTYNYMPVLIGATLPLYTNSVSVFPVITEIKK